MMGWPQESPLKYYSKPHLAASCSVYFAIHIFVLCSTIGKTEFMQAMI